MISYANTLLRLLARVTGTPTHNGMVPALLISGQEYNPLGVQNYKT
jgi:hypothetical protein